MTREDAIATARKYYVGFNFPTNGEPFDVPEWAVQAILEASRPPPELENFIDPATVAKMVPSGFQMAEEPEDVRALVLNMREFFLTLVGGYNAVGAYDSARDAQTMAIALHKFEDEHNVTGLTWPLEVIREEGNSPGLKTNYQNDSPRYGEDL